MKTNLSTETVQSLRQKGYKVRVKHYRYSLWGGRLTSKHTKLFPIKDLEGKIRHPKGGLTIIELDGPQGRFVGSSVCSKLDNFCYKTGVKIALGRMEEKNSFDFFGLAKKVIEFFSPEIDTRTYTASVSMKSLDVPKIENKY